MDFFVLLDVFNNNRLAENDLQSFQKKKKVFLLRKEKNILTNT